MASRSTRGAAMAAGACLGVAALGGQAFIAPSRQQEVSRSSALRGSAEVGRPAAAEAPEQTASMAVPMAGVAAVAVCGLVAKGSERRRCRAGKTAAKALQTATSDKIFAEAKGIMPGGVSSPVRAFASVGGDPIVFDKVKGAYAWDVDGNKYIDYVGSWGPAIIGHADDEVLKALNEQMAKGTSFGAPCALENELAKMVIDAVPSVEMVRFTNSGTEACMGMLRLVRAYTKRETVIKFEGCYHGHADSFLVQAGSGVATLGLPDSPGVPGGATKGTLCATYCLSLLGEQFLP
eukprot:TRINITY_DN1315_c0_g1_i2.p1 TRINITY_DN1315_c0_g1~~TRINITY_DN1315_c0_g1_i2.p1  ORF type:complete len:316 (-),score=65.38 TRINITY_DN1315_c0_g1_i2:283-1158(-)